MSKHTPGPWRIVRLQPNYALGMRGPALEIATDTFDVVTATPGLPPIRNEADARLIAAAPELLEALRPFAEVDYEELIGAPDDMPIEEALRKAGQPTVGDLRRAMDAIAKAEGQS